jgi:hypothetical protein
MKNIETNLELWNKVEKTETKYTKKVNMRGGFTAIDPTYQSKLATEQFGRYGIGWGLRDINIEYMDIKEKVGEKKMAVLLATFFTPEGEVETGNAIEVNPFGKSDPDFMKKLITNTLSKELARLGFNSDVFLGKFDDERYVQGLKQEEVNEDLAEIAIKEMDEIKTLDELKKYFSGLRPAIMNNPIVLAKKDELKEKLTTIQNEDTK